MADLKLDVSSHDLTLNNDNFELTSDTDEAVAQRLKIRLLFFKGEWFLNENFGVPYFQNILKKQSDLTVVDAIFRRKILETPGVEELLEYSSTFDGTLRSFEISFKVRSQDAQTLALTFAIEV